MLRALTVTCQVSDSLLVVLSAFISKLPICLHSLDSNNGSSVLGKPVATLAIYLWSSLAVNVTDMRIVYAVIILCVKTHTTQVFMNWSSMISNICQSFRFVVITVTFWAVELLDTLQYSCIGHGCWSIALKCICKAALEKLTSMLMGLTLFVVPFVQQTVSELIAPFSKTGTSLKEKSVLTPADIYTPFPILGAPWEYLGKDHDQGTTTDYCPLPSRQPVHLLDQSSQLIVGRSQQPSYSGRLNPTYNTFALRSKTNQRRTWICRSSDTLYS